MLNIVDALTFDDVLLIPKYSDIESRSSIDLSVSLPKGIKLKHPIVPANMKTICGYEMAEAAYNTGGMALLHRFMPIEEQFIIAQKIGKLENGFNHIGFSIGVKKEDYAIVDKFASLGVKILVIDIAHGHSKLCVDITKYILQKYPNIFLIAGNVATGEGARMLWKAGADMVKVNIGAGCFAAGTKVLMSGGFYKNIEDIAINDYVINKNGKPVKVLNAFSTGTKKVLKIVNNSFYKETYATPDHQFWVGDYSTISNISQVGYKNVLDKQSKTIPKSSKYKWKTIKEVNNDTFLFPKNIQFNMPETFEIILNKRISGNGLSENSNTYEKINMTPSYDLGYIFGTFLGDGNAMTATIKNGTSNIGAVQWYFGINEENIVNKLTQSIKNIFNRDVKITKKDNIFVVKLHLKPLADFLTKWGKSEEKHLPNEYLISNKEYLKGIKDGLIDSDGNVEKSGRTGFTNTSEKLIELFGIISFILEGGLPISQKKKISIGNLKNANIDNFNQAYQSRILMNIDYRLTNDYFIVKKMFIEETNIEVPVYDITVDCDTHSFIANNMIVHNSLCTTRVETGNGVSQVSALNDVWDAKQSLQKEIGRPIFVMADGGCVSNGDFVKSLCFSDLVMTGRLFAGSEETPGENMTIDGATYKNYVGSSTHKTNHKEGVEALVKATGRVKDILNKSFESIRSGLSYQGCRNLSDLKIDPRFVRITAAGLKESGAHDVIVVR